MLSYDNQFIIDTDNNPNDCFDTNSLLKDEKSELNFLFNEKIFDPSNIHKSQDSFSSDSNSSLNMNELLLINGGENIGKITLEQKSKNIFAIEITSTNRTTDLNPRTKKIILPKHYTFEKIKNEIIPKLNLDEIIKKAFIYDENVKIIEKETSDENFAIIKRERAKRGTIIREEEEEKNKKNLGRKRRDDNEVHDHNKHSKDNILQKLKTHIQKFLLQFINAFLKKNLDKNAIIIYVEKTKTKEKGKGKEMEEEKEIIKRVDYKAYVNKTSKSDNLKFLDMPIKTFLSQDISPKFSTFPKKANKIIIDEILRNNKSEVINFIFNLKLSDWLDVFLKKKEFSDFEGFKLNFTIDMKDRVEELLKIIYSSEKDKSYFSRFILYIYNFTRILSIKQERKSKKNDSNNSSKDIDE